MQSLRALQPYLDAQDAFLLLRCLLSSRLGYLLRVVPVSAQLAPVDPVLAAHRTAADAITDAALA